MTRGESRSDPEGFGAELERAKESRSASRRELERAGAESSAGLCPPLLASVGNFRGEKSEDRLVRCIEGTRRDGATPAVVEHTADRERFSGAGVVSLLTYRCRASAKGQVAGL